jgi:3-deoxy-D-manno-octulosonic-acid transferase
MTRLIYNLILLFFFPLFVLHYIYGKFYLRKYSRSFWERFGVFKYIPPAKKQKTFLVHAVSVGETVAAQPFVEALTKEYPETAIIFSNVTETGHNRAEEIIKADAHVFFPVDYPSAVRNFMDRVKPDAAFIIETEIWPNFLWECQKRHIPVFFINGRISDRSFERYSLFRYFMNPILKAPLFLMQTSEDARRIESLGATQTFATGNLKYDQLAANLSSPKRAELKKTFHFLKQQTIVFGSTHQKETKGILEMIAEWKNQQLDCAHYIIAPRHLNHLPDYQKQAVDLGLKIQLKSQLNPEEDFDCLFLDTYGELSCIYEIANIVFIGGSLEPVGGHSILEPAIFSKPVLYGPHMENNRDICHKFEQDGAAIRVNSFPELKQRIEFLLLNEKLRTETGTKACKIATSMTGATANIISHIKKHLN